MHDRITDIDMFLMLGTERLDLGYRALLAEVPLKAHKLVELRLCIHVS